MSQERVLREILLEIEKDPSVSQKRISESVGVSVGMVNWHIKRCVTKGLIKLQQAPVRRYLYYLTPEGFAEKANLTAEYLKASFDIFSTGRQQYESLFQLCASQGWHSIILVGRCELTELALLVSAKYPSITIVETFDTVNGSSDKIEIAYTKQSTSLTIDAVIATDFNMRLLSNESLEKLKKQFRVDQNQILIPAFLR